MSQTEESLVVVVRSDGRPVFPEHAPRGWWRDDALAETAPPALRDALTEVTAAAAHRGAASCRAEIAMDGRATSVVVVVVDAVPLRRALITVDSLVSRTMDLFVAQVGGGVSLHVERRGEMPAALHADGEKLTWALATLVGNAIRLLAHHRPHGASRVHLRVGYEVASRTFRFAVEDDGPGMATETARWLFERDPRTGRSAGLALRMVKDVVAAHGGAVSVVSALGEGTTITLHVPRGGP